MGSRIVPYGALGIAALRGREAEASELIEDGTADVMRRGAGVGLSYIHWATAVLGNGLGRYQDALGAAEQASEGPQDLWSTLVLPELVEAATRRGQAERATGAFGDLIETTRASGTEWALGIQARSRALLSVGEAAEPLYREAIQRLGRTRLRVELGRANLLYGEWLRGQRRIRDARDQLRIAHELFGTLGAEAFAERARIQLRAVGGHTPKRTARTPDALTAQEAQIARLAAHGATNPEIAARLFISPNTVAYHLRKVFAKLGISSRNQLARLLHPPPNPPHSRRSPGALGGTTGTALS
jgi:DNA-binding CsgD family transcriptional regulator